MNEEKYYKGHIHIVNHYDLYGKAANKDDADKDFAYGIENDHLLQDSIEDNLLSVEEIKKEEYDNAMKMIAKEKE